MGRVGIAVACALTFVVSGVTYARAHDDAPRIVARVRCSSTAEDTLGHVRLVSFDRSTDGSVRVVYRCMHTGY